MEITLQQKVKRISNDLETPISLFMERIGRQPAVLLESAEVDGRWGRYSLAATDFLLVAECRSGLLKLSISDDRLAALKKLEGLPYLEGLRQILAALNIDQDMPGLPPITRGLYGYLGYGAVRLMEKKLASCIQPEEAEGAFVLPGSIYLFDHTYNQLLHLTLKEACPKNKPLNETPPNRASLGEIKTSLNKEEFVKAVKEVKELIRTGEAIQVVLATRFSAEFTGDLFSVYRNIRHINPSPYMFYLKLPELAMAVSSPEVMVSCDQNQLRLCPIAGTRPRGNTAEEEKKLAAELAADPKEQSEHVMLVDLGRNDLGRVAAPGTVKVERLMEVEKFSHVMHLTSYIKATLESGLDAIDIISAAFPAGTLSGAPKVRAMEIISGFEPAPRQVYGGALGWIGLDKDSVNLDLGISIRGAWARGGEIFWEAGAGLVHDSDPQSEWRECQNKAAVVKAAIEMYIQKSNMGE